MPKQFYAQRTLAFLVLPLLFGFFNRSKTTTGETNYRIRTVVLDAGHGGHDTGCLGEFSKEKDNALAITLALGQLIEAHFPQIKVVYTRDEDVFVPLIDRAKIANDAKADLFICIHCNSIGTSRNQKVEGTETYVLGVDRQAHNLEVAKRENASVFLEKDYKKTYGDFDNDSPEATILTSAWQSAYLENSITLANFFEKAVAESGRTSRGVKQAGFLVLRETAMPSVLIETGYLTNDSDEALLSSEDGQSETAQLIFTAFSNYKNQVEHGSAKTVVAAAKAVSKPIKSTEKPTKTVEKQPESVRLKKTERPAPTEKTNSTFKILLTTSTTRLSLKRDPLALVGQVEEAQADGKFQYFAVGFSSKEEAKKAISELKSLGFENPKLMSDD